MSYRNNISDSALSAWDTLLELHGEPLSVNSGYRSPEHNARVGGAKHSQHTHGNAFDVNVAHMTPEQRQALARKALEAGFSGVGVYDNSFHFDVGPKRAWGSDYSKGSLPDDYAWLMSGDVPASQPDNRLAAHHDEERPVNALYQANFTGLEPQAFQMPTNQLAQDNNFLRFLS